MIHWISESIDILFRVMSCLFNLCCSIGSNATLRAEVLEQWEEHKTGPLVNAGATHIGWSRVPDDSPIFKVSPDPSAGANTPHYELIFGVRG